MTVVSSKEFTVNQNKIYRKALKERIFIKRGKNLYYLTCTSLEDDDDISDLADAKAAENDENINVDDYLKSIYERAKCELK